MLKPKVDLKPMVGRLMNKKVIPNASPLTPELVQKVADACALLSAVARDGREDEPIKVCSLAVLDFQLRRSMLERALDHFYSKAAPELGHQVFGRLRQISCF